MIIQKQTGRNICSVEDVQRYVNNSTTSLTAFIQNCISSVSMQFENYCDKGLKFNSYEDIYDGDGSNSLNINQYPVASISSIQYLLTPTSEWSDFYTDSSTANIQLCSYGKLILYNKYFPNGINNIKIIYSAGFTDCPMDLKQICIEEVSTILGESDVEGLGKSNLGIKTKSNANEQYSFENINDRIQKVLDYYKRYSV